MRSEDGCRRWIGFIGTHGYGSFSVDGKEVLAHRWAYEHWKGPIPEGMQIDHLCRVRACVEVEHLEVVTPRENVLRGISPAAAQAKQTRCVHGHPFDDENTYWEEGRKRHCRACMRDSNRRRRLAWEASPSGAPCAIDGCGMKAWSRGWCRSHYHSWSKYGDPMVQLRRSRTRVSS